LKAVVGGWQVMARALGSVAEMVIQGILPWCLTPELYAAKPEHIDGLAQFVRSRPVQPLDAFIRQSHAVIAHDLEGQRSKIKCPRPGTCGRHEAVTSTRFAEPMTKGIAGAELIVFEGCSHAPIYERVDEFNERTLAFLKRA